MLYIESKNIINFTHTLSKLHRSALPNAVRFTLNDAARDVKFNTLQKNAQSEFDVKKPSFFKAFSRYQPATGWNISAMKSTVGMVKAQDPKKTASTKIAAQQFAGIVKDRAYIPQEAAKTNKGTLKQSFTNLLKQGNAYVYEKEKGGNYIQIASKSLNEKKPLLVRKNGKGYLVSVKKINKEAPIVETEILASYKKDRDIKLKTKHPFVNNAAMQSGAKIETMFIKNAKKQIARLK